MDKQNLKRIVNRIQELDNPLGKFIIDGDLGEGGTSVVKKARLAGEENSRKYAIKFLLVDIAENKSTEYKRFRQAYINLASVQHLGCCIPFMSYDSQCEHQHFVQRQHVSLWYLFQVMKIDQ